MNWLQSLLRRGGGESSSQVESLIGRIEEAYSSEPPTLAVIGLSGAGKSSVINAMFGTSLRTSATIRGTSEFESIRAKLTIQRGEGTGGIGYLRVFDAPGLGEDRRLDPHYLQMYAEHLPKCDVALWLLAARNRALALDQTYLERLGPLLEEKVVFALSQCDLVDPLNWDRMRNLPSVDQQAHIAEIVEDRSRRLSDALGRSVRCIAFSSSNYYRLMELYEHIIGGVDPSRRWMFEFVRSFSVADWLSGAEGLSQQEKEALLRSDSKT